MNYIWSKSIPFYPRAMLLAGDTLLLRRPWQTSTTSTPSEPARRRPAVGRLGGRRREAGRVQAEGLARVRQLRRRPPAACTSRRSTAGWCATRAVECAKSLRQLSGESDHETTIPRGKPAGSYCISGNRGLDAGGERIPRFRGAGAAAPPQRRPDHDRQPRRLDAGLLRQPGHPHAAHRPAGPRGDVCSPAASAPTPSARRPGRRC